MSGVNDIRSAFLDYFAAHGHANISSSPLVPRNDPTLMFTNAGMVQFKNVFTGLEVRDYSRAATSQKCVRAGGKHNDLDNVGYTARHHTFFEMLGNFSFGDYFKEEAIGLAWNLLTKEFSLKPENLLVTVYHTDDMAAELWKKIAGLSSEKIIRIPTSDNFWAMGDTGPCGPCSEIFYDHGEGIFGGPPGSPDEDGDRFIEIWNLVFMQFEQLTPDERVDLPKPSIDTGMGLERVAAVLQGKHDNYDIDLFKTLIAASEELTSTKAEGDSQPSHRVIADHLRASSFLIADGVLPSNEGRGYVLRRIMRRAMRHGSLLGAQEPLMNRLVKTLVAEMGDAYPELSRAQSLIEETLELEEVRFRKTLKRGLGLLDEASASLGHGDDLDGETAFKLYDTYGFPLDLTQDALRRRGIGVDTKGFDGAMERQRAEARKAWTGSGEAADERIWFTLKDRLGATEFLGYDTEQAEGLVQALLMEGAEVETISAGQKIELVVNQTPFYAESGGQVGDRGEARFEGGRISIHATRKYADGVFVHFGQVEEGELSVGAPVELEIDHHARAGARSHHSATHLVHEALRKVLGDHVAQKGSLVTPNRLRFDFSHQKAIDEKQLSQVEQISNAVVRQSAPVETRIMAVDDAVEAGAMALFGEKYGDEVRVVSMGREADDSVYSLELCGGTHVSNTGEIGLIHVLGESAVAAGVRRVEALTGQAALDYLSRQEARVQEMAGLLKVPTEKVVERVASLMEERKKLERDLMEARRQLASGGADSNADADEINGIKFSGRVVENLPARELKGLVDIIKQQIGSGIAVVVGKAEDGKAGVVVGVTDDLTDQFSAVDLVQIASQTLGGKGGGGRPNMAQAGGPDASKAQEALDAVRARLL